MAVLPGCQLCQRTASRQDSASTVFFMLMQPGHAELGSMPRTFSSSNNLTTTRRLCPADICLCSLP